MGDPPSGDSDRARFMQLVKDTWAKRNPEDSKLVETVCAMKMTLEKHPKWQKFQVDQDNSDEAKKKKREAKAARPEGSKKAKQAMEDKKTLETLVSTQSVTSKNVNEEGITRVADSFEFLSKGNNDCQICMFHGFLICFLSHRFLSHRLI